MSETNQNEKIYRVAFYLRVSTDEQVEKYGLDLQKEALFALIKSKGNLSSGKPSWELAGEKHIYVDQGISGTVSIDERPGFAQLKEDVLFAPEGNRPFDIVAVYKIDRFARKLKVLLEVIDFFEQHEIQFVSANESIDTSTPFGKAMLGIIGIIAELERNTIIKRTRDGREVAAYDGVIMSRGGYFGYKKDSDKRPIILEEEAQIVREIFQLFVNGRSAESIARHLTNCGVLIPEASAVRYEKRKGEIRGRNSNTYWRSETIRTILKNELYIGKQYFNKVQGKIRLPKNEWKTSNYVVPPIIDILTFEKAQRMLDQIKHTRKNDNRSRRLYLLSGLLKCDFCYKPDRDKRGRATWLGERKKIKEDHYTYFYNCGHKKLSKALETCPVISLPGTEIEDYVTNFCLELIKSPVTVFKHQQELQSTKSQINRTQKRRLEILKLIETSEIRRERLKEQHEERIIDTVRLKAKLAQENNRIQNLNMELKNLEVELAQFASNEQYAATLELFSKKYTHALDTIRKDREALYDLIHLLVEEIVVFSRPVTSQDKIAGIRKENQQIPDELHIKLKLPQEIIQELANPMIKGSGQKSVSGAR